MPIIEPYSCAKLIREIGRGKNGARGLTREQSAQLLDAILQDRVSDIELGAVLIALRVKGESLDELLGFMDALMKNWTLTAQLNRLFSDLDLQSRQSEKPVIVIPSYNGARRKPNFTPLIAGLLSQKGYPVLCHGLGENHTGRVSTKEIFDCMDWPANPVPMFCAIEIMFPELKTLLSKQQVLGLRNFSHTLVKLLVPPQFKRSLLVTSYTHPEFLGLQTSLLSQYGQVALVLRGHEGEAVASPYRIPRMDIVVPGRTWQWSEPESGFTGKPDPHPEISAQATAELTRRWISQPELLPHGLLKQLEVIQSVASQYV